MTSLAFTAEELRYLSSLRQDFHAHPELGFEEERTSQRVAEELTKIGIPVTRGIGKTGVIGVIEGEAGPGRSIGLRADMDALPIHEESNLPFRSTVHGCFHGCGHDGHMTMLIAAARQLQARKAEICGRIVLIFQPAEEGRGGARAMIADGLFQRFPCDEIYALHNAPDRDLGKIAVGPGPVSASADFFDIDIAGNGGHAAFPHRTVDAGLAAIAIAQGLHTIVSRNVDPVDSAVLSVTAMTAGSTYNVIPDTARLSGTIRTMRPDVRKSMAERLVALADSIAAGYGAKATVDIRDVFSTLVNDPLHAAIVADVAAKLVGEDNLDRKPPIVMTSEDFADMLLQVPGAYFFLGQGQGAALHNPRYAFNDAVIPFGASMFVEVAMDRCGTPGSVGWN
ncbi:M20 aminoacylase family protein [Rhodopseudomonas sp. B29]|uniref:M20 aminoacylase family protein n=1 Tax=Rhodopseudomonas sp. B29 TaxID=95607 RepID=UPI00034AFA78|nr:M20 aminoacylase family protein [Rhodopseudomonas sp. B29]